MNSRTIQRRAARSPSARRGFTLIEIMVVVAIIGIIMVSSVPMLSRFVRKEGFRKTVAEFMDVCKAARSRAVLQEVTTQVVFYPREGRCELSGGKESQEWGGLAHKAELDRGTRIEMLYVNMADCKDADSVGVHFYPEGTCDEMTLILLSDRQERREISLEITTGRVRLESDPLKFGR